MVHTTDDKILVIVVKGGKKESHKYGFVVLDEAEVQPYKDQIEIAKKTFEAENGRKPGNEDIAALRKLAKNPLLPQGWMSNVATNHNPDGEGEANIAFAAGSVDLDTNDNKIVSHYWIMNGDIVSVKSTKSEGAKNVTRGGLVAH